jgi:type IV secretory pathway protease TraF
MLRLASFKLASAVALIVLFAFAMASAQSAPTLKYLTSSEVKVKGTVEEVRTATDNTVHITVKNDKGSVDVLVAPEKFLKEMEIIFAKGDAVEVTGSQVTVDGAAVLLAREVGRNGDVMMMRDEHGKPVWVGWIK